LVILASKNDQVVYLITKCNRRLTDKIQLKKNITQTVMILQLRLLTSTLSNIIVI